MDAGLSVFGVFMSDPKLIRSHRVSLLASGFRDGVALCIVVHHHFPDALSLDAVDFAPNSR
jgi:hypothetical protein